MEITINEQKAFDLVIMIRYIFIDRFPPQRVWRHSPGRYNASANGLISKSYLRLTTIVLMFLTRYHKFFFVSCSVVRSQKKYLSSYLVCREERISQHMDEGSPELILI